MQQVSLISYSPEELSEIVQRAIRAEVPTLVSAEINRILATSEEDRCVMRPEAMQITGIKSRSTILKLEREGLLTPIRIGGNRVSYRLQEVRDLITKRTRA